MSLFINLIEEIYYCCFFVYIHKIQIFEKTFFICENCFNAIIPINLNKENKSKLETLLKKVADVLSKIEINEDLIRKKMTLEGVHKDGWFK